MKRSEIHETNIAMRCDPPHTPQRIQCASSGKRRIQCASSGKHLSGRCNLMRHTGLGTTPSLPSCPRHREGCQNHRNGGQGAPAPPNAATPPARLPGVWQFMNLTPFCFHGAIVGRRATCDKAALATEPLRCRFVARFCAARRTVRRAGRCVWPGGSAWRRRDPAATRPASEAAGTSVA